MSLPRRNRSGGPRTDVGKLSASKNALKSGAYSEMTILPGESEEDFLRLRDRFMLDFSPQDIAETTLVHDLSILTWKKLRLDKLNYAALIQTLNEPIRLYEYSGIYAEEFPPQVEELLPYVDEFFPDKILKFAQAAELAKSFVDGKLSASELMNKAIDDQNLFFHLKKIGNLFYEITTDIDTPELFWEMLRSADDEGKPEAMLIKIAEDLINESRFISKNMARGMKVRDKVLEIREKRLLSAMEIEKPRRAYDDLNRQFFKVLSELRKHQSWRDKMGFIDVAEEPEA